jgi:hypothetical protein
VFAASGCSSFLSMAVSFLLFVQFKSKPCWKDDMMTVDRAVALLWSD